MYPKTQKKVPYSHCLGKVCSDSEIQDITTTLSKESAWQAHVNQLSYTGNWDVLALRCVALHVNSHPILQCFTHEGAEASDPQAWVDLPSLERYPILKTWLKQLPFPVKSVRFMRLHTGAEILPHRDKGVNVFNGEVRLHIPITSAPGVAFYVEGEKVAMGIGELWYIDADREHWVKNNSSFDRVHLILDCIANDYLRGKILV